MRSHLYSEEETNSQQAEFNHRAKEKKQFNEAVQRSALLSPRHSQFPVWLFEGRADDDVEDDDSQAVHRSPSFETVMAILFRNVHSIRRSISLPDLSRLHAMFNKCSPRLENIPVIASPSPSPSRLLQGNPPLAMPLSEEKDCGDNGSITPDDVYFDASSVGDIGLNDDRLVMSANCATCKSSYLTETCPLPVTNSMDSTDPLHGAGLQQRSRFDSGFGDGISYKQEVDTKCVASHDHSDFNRKLGLKDQPPPLYSVYETKPVPTDINRNERCRRSKRKERPRGYVFEDHLYE